MFNFFFSHIKHVIQLHLCPIDRAGKLASLKTVYAKWAASQERIEVIGYIRFRLVGKETSLNVSP